VEMDVLCDVEELSMVRRESTLRTVLNSSFGN